MKNYLLLLTMCVLTQCYSQNKESSYDFFSFIKDPDYIRTTTFTIENEDDVTVVYYEFSMTDTHVGQGRIFAISKQYPEQWTKDAIENPQGECNKSGNFTPFFYTQCMMKSLFVHNKEKLIKDFDIYTFFVDKDDLEGPFQESSEAGDVDYYNEKIEGDIIVYKYINNVWIEIDRIKNIDDRPRAFSFRYIKKIAENKVFKKK